MIKGKEQTHIFKVFVSRDNFFCNTNQVNYKTKQAKNAKNE